MKWLVVVVMMVAGSVNAEELYRWTAATGPVANYDVMVSRNNGPFTLMAQTAGATPECRVPAAAGETISVRVAARNGAQAGPLSAPSVPYTVPLPLGVPSTPERVPQ